MLKQLSSLSFLGISMSNMLFIATGLMLLVALLLFIFAPKKGKHKKKKNKTPGTVALVVAAALALGGTATMTPSNSSFSLSDIPEYSGDPYIVIDDNKPSFTEDEITTIAYEKYSELDILGRCGVVEACCGKELMPAEGEDRESISSVTPSGWVQAKYDFVDGTYLYNRCHLIGWQITAENANERNLIAGTRYLNIEGMLPFENMVADYIKETGNHVMYRVTPIYHENDLLPRGVQMEGYSVEDNGEGISFNVFCYNVQPGVTIDYATGRSCASGETLPPVSNETDPSEEYTGSYILNTSSKKVHKATCSNALSITDENKEEYSGELADFPYSGYTLCGVCLKGEELPAIPETTPEETNAPSEYVLNTKTKKIHLPSCRYAVDLAEENKEIFNGEDLSELLNDGYTKCGTCLK